jgi:hypothetical protein
MTTEDDTADLRFLDWKETTASTLIDRVGQLSIAQFREWLTRIEAADEPTDIQAEYVAVVEFLAAELRNLLHQELSADYPELAEALRYLSFDEALRAVYSATHGRS